MSHGNGRGRGVGAVLLLLASFTVGCAARDIDVKYGRRTGASVNGTGALAGMFRQRGFRVSTWRRFSPRLEQADVLVWFNSDFTPPTAEQRLFVERWLGNSFSRTLIYVGRDFDAAPVYWHSLEDSATAAQWEEYVRRTGRATTQFEHERQAAAAQFARWFVVRPDGPRYRPAGLAGPWAEHVDAAQTQLELQTRLDPPKDEDIVKQAATTPPATTPLPTTVNSRPLTGPRRPPRTLANDSDEATVEDSKLVQNEILLSSDRGDAIVSRILQGEVNYPWPSWNDGQIIVVANGSFLLNLPLVNHEHRKLASRLIDACGPARSVVFLEPGVNGLPVMQHEEFEGQQGFVLFRVWPLNVVLVHIIVLGLLYCLARSPIFGRPRTLPLGPVSDFSKHLVAVGELLEATRNSAYARQLIANYHAVKAKESR